MQNRQLAVITGAFSGIGLELARIFAKNDFDLLIVSDSMKIHEAAKLLRQYEVDVVALEADLASLSGVDLLYERIKAYPKNVDVLVLNAGVGLGGAPFWETDFADELNMINLNVTGLVKLTKLVLKDMLMKNEGKLLFTSSIAAETPGPYLSVYAATKAFVQSFVEALRFELKEADKKIMITALQPGATETEFFERAGMQDTKVGEAKKDDAAQVAQDGFDALMAGKDHVVAGSFKNVVSTTAAKFMSEKMAAKAQAKDTRPNDLSP